MSQVSGAETTLVNRQDGLHVYMRDKNEQFEFVDLIFHPDGRVVDKYNKSAYHFEIIEKQLDGNGQFHAKIWK